MATLDLNKLRTARAAEREKPDSGWEPRVVKFNDLKVKLPDELPGKFATALAVGDFVGCINAVFGEDAPRFWDMDPTVDDIRALSDGLGEMYGFTNAGE